MKVAVLLTGLIREGIDLLQNNYNCFIKDINPDIYIHSYECDNKNKILDFYKPIKYVFENIEKVNTDYNFEKYGKDRYYPETRLDNCLHMWRKRKEGYNLIENSYDKIIIFRFDSYGIKSIKEYLTMEGLCIPKGGDWRGGLFDICAFADKESMSYYCSLFDKIDEYYDNHVDFHPESLLKYHIFNSPDITLQRFDMPVMLRGGQINP
jgi:hypothetical protein